jgi:hypothetical protein
MATLGQTGTWGRALGWAAGFRSARANRSGTTGPGPAANSLHYHSDVQPSAVQFHSSVSGMPEKAPGFGTSLPQGTADRRLLRRAQARAGTQIQLRSDRAIATDAQKNHAKPQRGGMVFSGRGDAAPLADIY